MMPWYAPTSITAWLRRLLSPRPLLLGLLVVGLMTTELRLDWLERMAGYYLATTNPQRPRYGAIWDQGRQADQARQALAQFANQRQNLQREARQAGSLAEVVATIAEDTGAMISADHFADLYLKLPPVLSQEILSPFTLLAYNAEGQWQRTFLERQDGALTIYLLDAQNQVLHRLNVGPLLLGHIERGEVAIQTGLDQLLDFSLHIYPADRFFKTLNTLPEQVQQRIISHPRDLLGVSGRIRRVAISSGAYGDAVDLGFEVEGLDGPRVILMQGVREDVRRLQQMLEAPSDASRRWTEGGRP
ncbi:hypothetical protein [Desulfatitalea alkaliphila]|uniref:Uncharacterized protein n=1 Tax=Desulfatitalea alkaliphila TaxID=2929485 RepID=A0AA41RAK3_9BACT|nr:hypothetical protein [Desulfatitalea alkaliphila]MCJ8501653.1 hypothetical protein [Desulfatitalea alkaliphila]